MGCHFLLQGIFPTQGLNSGLLHCRHGTVQPVSPMSFMEETDLKLTLKVAATAAAKLLQSCLTLWDPVDCSLPGSSVHRIFQARILEWVVISFSRGSSQHRD